MPRVHITRARAGVSHETITSTIQRYTGLGTVEARRAAADVLAGRAASVYVDDFTSVYELADVLTSLGCEAEADETDY